MAAFSDLYLRMQRPIHIAAHIWDNALHELEDAFGVVLTGAFRRGEVHLEALLQELTIYSPEPSKLGGMVIAHELQQELGQILGIDPKEIHAGTQLAALLPSSSRKAQWQALQSRIDWKLPPLGLPAWAQSVWGFGMFAGFVLQFVLPWYGIALFWGGMLLSFQAEKRAWAFQYPTFAAIVDRTVVLNWPALEMGAADDTRVRVAFADMLHDQIGQVIDPSEELPTLVIEDIWDGLGAQAHLLGGDTLRLAFEDYYLPGARIVMRECLCVGPVSPAPDFFSQRAAFIQATYDSPVEKYQQWVMTELQKLEILSPDTQLNLWFEENLFSQVNLWFSVDHWAGLGKAQEIFWVPPLADASGNAIPLQAMDEAEMSAAFQQRIALGFPEVDLIKRMWAAYRTADHATMSTLASTAGPNFACWPAIVAAHLDRLPKEGDIGKPQRILKSILQRGLLRLDDVCQAFQVEAPIYGFTDLQIQEMVGAMGISLGE